MDELMEILEGIRPDVDFENEEELIADGILGSFDVVAIVGEINDAFDVEIKPNHLVPRTASRAVKNIEAFPMKAYYIQKEFLDIGKSKSNFNGVILPVYDRERTICDCFKYRTKLDNEIFNKSVNAYVVDEKKNLANLSKYAKEMNLYTKVMNVMEVLLNG